MDQGKAQQYTLKFRKYRVLKKAKLAHGSINQKKSREPIFVDGR